MKLLISILCLALVSAKDVIEPQTNNTNAPMEVFEGFIFGFLGESADPIENCTLSAQNSTTLFWTAMNTFQNANALNLVFVYMKGIALLIDFFQSLPPSIHQCHGLLASWNKVASEISVYFDVQNWVDIIGNIGESLQGHMFELMGYLTDGMAQLSSQQYYEFGVSVGEAVALIIAIDDIPDETPKTPTS